MVYLYVASLVGLGLLISGGVQAFEIGLKLTILPQADAEDRLWMRQPPMPPMFDAGSSLSETDGLTEEELVIVRRWLQDYERWEEERSGLNPVAARRERQGATALALIFVGIPVYLFHWLTIRKELGRGVCTTGNAG